MSDDRKNVDMGNTKRHYIKGTLTACGCKVPHRVALGWHVSEYGFTNPANPQIDCKRCLAVIAKSTN